MTPLLLPGPSHLPTHPAPHEQQQSEAQPPPRKGPLWRKQQQQQQDQQRQHHHHHHFLMQLPPPAPEDALLGGPRGYVPSDAVLRRSEFLLPLDEQQLELYSWLLGSGGKV